MNTRNENITLVSSVVLVVMLVVVLELTPGMRTLRCFFGGGVFLVFFFCFVLFFFGGGGGRGNGWGEGVIKYLSRL